MKINEDGVGGGGGGGGGGVGVIVRFPPFDAGVPLLWILLCDPQSAVIPPYDNQ